MKTPRSLILTTALCSFVVIGLGLSPLEAATIYNTNWTVNQIVPDDNPVGLVDQRVVSGSGILSITNLDVILNFSPGLGWNGDLYAYLQNNQGGYAVLLNRMGVTSANPIGSGSSGMNIRLSMSGLTDIHLVNQSSGLLTGTFLPDARAVDPSIVTDLSPRTADLTSFGAVPADGTWTLFIADVSGGDTSQLASWGMEFTGSPIPEPSALWLLATLGLMRRRRR